MSQPTSVVQSSHLLKLPMELLEMIADQVDTETSVLNIRLTCKELSTAAFKSFSGEYIDEISCFMLDPERLLRAKHITSTPHLARHITFFSFELDRLEGRDCALAVVLNQDEHHCDAVSTMISVATRQAYAVHGDALKTPRAIQLSLIESILRDLKHLPTCGIRISGLVGTPYADGWHDLEPSSNSLVTTCLDIARRVECQMTTIHATDRCILKAADFEEQGGLRSAVEDARRIEYTAFPQDAETLMSDRQISHVLAVRGMLRAVKRLESLRIHIVGCPNTWQEPKLARSVSELIENVDLSSLSELDLCAGQHRLEDVLDILQRSGTRLRVLALNSIRIVSSKPPWMDVLQVLQRVCKLEKISIRYAMWTNPEQGTFKYAYFRTEDKDGAQLVQKMETEFESAPMFLELNLRRGLSY